MPTLPDLHPTQRFAVGEGPDLRFTILDEADQPYPLLGATILRWRLHRGVMGAYDDDPSLDETDPGVVVQVIGDPEAGQVSISLDTATLQPGIYYHQLWLRDINSEDRMSAHGHLDLIGAL